MMMVGRKKKRGDTSGDSEENGLHKSESLLKYQNKCLCTIIDELKQKLFDKEASYNALQSKFTSLTKFITKCNSQLEQLNHSCIMALTENKLKLESSYQQQQGDPSHKQFASCADIISMILHHKADDNCELMLPDIKSVSDLAATVKTLIKTLLPILKESQTNLDKAYSSITAQDIIELNSNLEETIMNQSSELSKVMVEKENAVTQYEMYKSKIKEMNAQIEQMSTDNFNLKRKLNSHPFMPYINFEKKYLNKQIIEKHKCICDVCGKELSTTNANNMNMNITCDNSNSANITSNSNKNTHNNNHSITSSSLRGNNSANTNCVNNHTSTNSNINSNNSGDMIVDSANDVLSNANVTCGNSASTALNQDNASSSLAQNASSSILNDNVNVDIKMKDDESYELLVKQNEGLKSRIKELHDTLESTSSQTEITEEMLLNSKVFQSLISQAETILSKMETLRQLNVDLKKKNISLTQSKDTEIIMLNQKFKDKIDAFNKTVLESTRIIENNKQTINTLMNKIESLENMIKAKDSIDIHSMYDLFTRERLQLMKQMESIKLLKKEYLNKYDDECEKNKTNELTIFKLNNEIDELKKILQNANINPAIATDERKKMYDYNNDVIKRKKEKINLLKKENSSLKMELDKERGHNEKIIEMSVTSEKGITDLNNIIKSLKLELQETKEIQAKMTNEKVKDTQTILLLKEGKDNSEKTIVVLQEQVDNYHSYTQKMDNELNGQKKLNSLLKETIKLNENDLDKLKKQNIENLKLIEKERIHNVELQKQINDSKDNLSKQLTDYDVLKVKYDELCKVKKYDPSMAGYDNLVKTNEILTMENDKFRRMVLCKICKTNTKNVVINRCFHTFCRSCVEGIFDARRRKCPICRKQISQNDVQEIYWE